MSPCFFAACSLAAGIVASDPAPSGGDAAPATVAAEADTVAPIIPVEVGPNPVESFTNRRGETGYRSGPCVVDTPLPVDYPRPTAPGAIEIKFYPSVRRAEVKGKGTSDDGMRGRGSSGAFWPLFRHIQRRDIAMTSPVETDYSENGWTMSFLYREPTMGDTGADGSVRIYDAPPVTVVSIGVQGDLDGQQAQTLVERLDAWAASSSEWRRAGDARKLGYNGPDVRARNRWHEVQLPIERRTPPDSPVNAGP